MLKKFKFKKEYDEYIKSVLAEYGYASKEEAYQALGDTDDLAASLCDERLSIDNVYYQYEDEADEQACQIAKINKDRQAEIKAIYDELEYGEELSAYEERQIEEINRKYDSIIESLNNTNNVDSSDEESTCAAPVYEENTVNNDTMNVHKDEAVMTTKNRESKNRESLCEMMEQAYNDNRLIEASLEDAGEVYVLLDDEEQAVVALEKNSGEFMFTKAGKNKSNKRQYVSLPLVTNKSYMCSNYTFRIIAEGLLSDKPEHKERYSMFKEGKHTWRKYTREECIEMNLNPSEGMMGPIVDMCDINHINGNSLDNRDCNLEVDTKGMNLAHARFMAEVHAYYPDLISEEIDCQGNKMHQWTDGVGVSCSQIRDWNKLNKGDEIKAFKDKKGQFTSKLTLEQIDRMLTYFGKK